MTTPEYVPSRHALLRMAQRRISAEEVIDVLRNHHTRYTDPRGSEVMIGHPNGRRVKIVVAKGSNPLFIITVAD